MKLSKRLIDAVSALEGKSKYLWNKGLAGLVSKPYPLDKEDASLNIKIMLGLDQSPNDG